MSKHTQKHTPGPWRLAGPSDHYVLTAGGRVVAKTGLLDVDLTTAEANARLIAAAPELLGVLIGFAMVARSVLRKHDIPELDGAVSAAELMIANAIAEVQP